MRLPHRCEVEIITHGSGEDLVRPFRGDEVPPTGELAQALKFKGRDLHSEAREGPSRDARALKLRSDVRVGRPVAKLGRYRGGRVSLAGEVTYQHRFPVGPAGHELWMPKATRSACSASRNTEPK
jgi:hypothetical protein